MNRFFGIHIATNCAILTDLFLYSYVADLIKGLHKKHDNKLVSFFSITFRYIDDVLSLNSKFHDYVNRIHPIEIKDATYTITFP